jgi:hypothetical protein
LLADVARHVVNALHENDGIDPRETIEAIRESFLTELYKPTSRHHGSYVSESGRGKKKNNA